jgi:glutaconate CoA-transferase subunit B
MELMITIAARSLEDGAAVVVGTGAPCAAAMLAQKTQSPNLIIMFEAGGVAPILPSMPISVGDSRTVHKSLKATTMAEIMGYCQAGMVDYCFLGGAQIDRYGNMNSTVIGDYYKPRTRFPGSGGANDLASLCWRTVVMTPQTPRRFSEPLDFLTTPGYLQGGDSRYEAGLPLGTGPYRVITDLGVYGYHPESKEMMMLSIHPGVTEADIQAKTGFDILIPETHGVTREPTAEDLRILREEVDPHGYVVGRA